MTMFVVQIEVPSLGVLRVPVEAANAAVAVRRVLTVNPAIDAWLEPSGSRHITIKVEPFTTDAGQ